MRAPCEVLSAFGMTLTPTTMPSLSVRCGPLRPSVNEPLVRVYPHDHSYSTRGTTAVVTDRPAWERRRHRRASLAGTAFGTTCRLARQYRSARSLRSARRRFVTRRPLRRARWGAKALCEPGEREPAEASGTVGHDRRRKDSARRVVSDRFAASLTGRATRCTQGQSAGEPYSHHAPTPQNRRHTVCPVRRALERRSSPTRTTPPREPRTTDSGTKSFHLRLGKTYQ